MNFGNHKRALLCPERQSMQIALFVPTVRKLKNHRHSLHKLIFILLFLLTFSTIFSRCLSVIVSVSPLCFQGGVLPSFILKDALHKTSPLVSAFTKRRQSSATLRCLTSLPSLYPTVVGRWLVLFFGADGVWLLTPSVFCFAKSTSLKEGGKRYLSN